VNSALRQGKPVAMILPDQKGIGAFVIPNTVAMIRNAPHPNEAKKLIDFLLSKEVEAKLSACGSLQIPLKPGVDTPPGGLRLSSIHAMNVSFNDVAKAMPASMRFMQETFLK
jgi:iron(III) transport system substrate-binding protein